MYINHFGTEEYPSKGTFYKIGIDDSKPLDQQQDEEVVVFETKCDMSSGTNLNTDTFKIYFPFDHNKEKILIKEGNLFRGEIFGMQQRGRVIGIYPSQLGGCTVLLTRI